MSACTVYPLREYGDKAGNGSAATVTRFLHEEGVHVSALIRHDGLECPINETRPQREAKIESLPAMLAEQGLVIHYRNVRARKRTGRRGKYDSARFEGDELQDERM